jgi:hypothetical protein
VLDSQQPLPRTITVTEVQERSTVKTHLPIWKAGSGKCTWRRSNSCTPRTAKSARKEVMANAHTDESRSRMHKLQTRMRSRLKSRRSQFSLDNLGIHSCYWKSTTESSLTNRYGTRRSRNGLVVGGATTYKRGMAVPEVLGGSTLERTYR